VVQQPPTTGRADPERHDRQAVSVQVAEQFDVGIGLPGGDGAAHEPGLAVTDGRDADGMLELEDQPGANRLDDRGSAALLPVRHVVQVVLAAGVDVGDGAAAGHGRYPVADQRPAHHQHTRGAGAAGELVRRQHHRVLAGQRAAGWRAHGDLQVRAGGGVVEAGQRAVAVQQLRHDVGVGDHAGDVGGGREAADLERPPGVADQLPLQVVEVEAAAGILLDGDHLGGRLAPGQLVGVVLEGADEHHRPRRRVGGQVQPQDAQELVDCAGGAGAGEDHRMLVVAADRLTDERSGLLA
jgi:hypothetical protein